MCAGCRLAANSTLINAIRNDAGEKEGDIEWLKFIYDLFIAICISCFANSCI